QQVAKLLKFHKHSLSTGFRRVPGSQHCWALFAQCAMVSDHTLMGLDRPLLLLLQISDSGVMLANLPLQLLSPANELCVIFVVLGISSFQLRAKRGVAILSLADFVRARMLLDSLQKLRASLLECNG